MQDQRFRRAKLLMPTVDLTATDKTRLNYTSVIIKEKLTCAFIKLDLRQVLTRVSKQK